MVANNCLCFSVRLKNLCLNVIIKQKYHTKVSFHMNQTCIITLDKLLNIDYKCTRNCAVLSFLQNFWQNDFNPIRIK